MSGDFCEVVKLDGVEIQQNGIIRDSRGWIIGRADSEWMRYQWRMLISGVCPCCCQKVMRKAVDRPCQKHANEQAPAESSESGLRGSQHGYPIVDGDGHDE